MRLSDQTSRSIAELACGCGLVTFCAATGGVGAGIAMGVVASAGLLVGGLQELARKNPESKRTIDRIRNKTIDQFRDWSERRGWESNEDLEAADAALEKNLKDCFLDHRALAISALDPEGFPNAASILIVTKLSELSPIFAVVGTHSSATGIAREYALAITRIALSAAVEERPYFEKLQPHLVFAQMQAIGRLEARTADSLELTEKLAQQAEIQARSLVVVQEQGLRALQEQQKTNLLLQALTEQLAKSNAANEIASLPERSNTAPRADKFRRLAKSEMAKNNTVEALRNMQIAEDIEEDEESESRRKIELLRKELRESEEFAEANSLARSRSQAALASICMSLQRFEEAAIWFERAISRAEAWESQPLENYRRGLRIAINASAVRTGTFDEARVVLFGSAAAGSADAYSYAILMAKAPDYTEARAVLGEMKTAKIPPNVISFNILMAKAPDYAEARAVLGEMKTAEIPPDVISFSTLMAKAPDYAEARAVLGEMKTANIPPDVISFNTLMAKAPDYTEARAVLGEMKTANIPPNAISFNTLMAKAPDYTEARAVLGEMKTANIPPDDFTSSSAAKHVVLLEQASELRTYFRKYAVAGTNFHRVIFTILARRLSALELLTWAYGDGKGAPVDAFDAAIALYRRRSQINEALRIISAFPYSEAASKVFRDNPERSKEYLVARYLADEEAHNASYALGFYYEVIGAPNEALNWYSIALDHPLTRKQKKPFIREAMDRCIALRAAL